MCVDVFFVDGEMCSNQGELSRKLGGAPLAFESGYDPKFDPTMCLCPIDLRKTASENGWTASNFDPQGEYEVFGFWFYSGSNI